MISGHIFLDDQDSNLIAVNNVHIKALINLVEGDKRTEGNLNGEGEPSGKVVGVEGEWKEQGLSWLL